MFSSTRWTELDVGLDGAAAFGAEAVLLDGGATFGAEFGAGFERRPTVRASRTQFVPGRVVLYVVGAGPHGFDRLVGDSPGLGRRHLDRGIGRAVKAQPSFLVPTALTAYPVVATRALHKKRANLFGRLGKALVVGALPSSRVNSIADVGDSAE